MFAVTPPLYLESKLRTNSASSGVQTPPKQTVASMYPRTSSQQLTPNRNSPSLSNNPQLKPTENYFGI